MGSFLQQASARKEGDLLLMSQGGRTLRELASLEPVRAEAESAAAGGRERGAPDRAGGGPGWQPGAGAGLPAPHTPGRDFKCSDSLAGPKGAACPQRGRGPSGGKKGYGKLVPRSRFPQALKAGPGLQCGVRLPQRDLRGLCRVMPLSVRAQPPPSWCVT